MDTLEIFIWAFPIGLPLLMIYLILCVYLLSINKVKLFWFVNFCFFAGIFTFFGRDVISTYSVFNAELIIKDYIAITIITLTPVVLLSGILYGLYRLKVSWYIMAIVSGIIGCTFLSFYLLFFLSVACFITEDCI